MALAWWWTPWGIEKEVCVTRSGRDMPTILDVGAIFNEHMMKGSSRPSQLA